MADLELKPYIAEIAKLERYLRLSESIGCHLLSSNCMRLHATAEDLISLLKVAVHDELSRVSKLEAYVGETKTLEMACSSITKLLPMMKDEETLAVHWDAVQTGLEATLPTFKAYAEMADKRMMPAMEAAMKPERLEAVGAAIRAEKQRRIDEEEARKAAETEKFFKSRAGKKLKALEDAKRREAAKKMEEHTGGKKKKQGVEEEESFSVKESAAKRREERAKRAENKIKSAASTPATIVGADASELVEHLQL